MHILPELSGSRNEELSTSGSALNRGQETPKRGGSEQAGQAADSASLPATEVRASVTLGRDADGKFFYKVTNSRTGELIMEFPPEAVRTVSKGIEEYVQQHARSGKKLEAKA